jgi:hypothetical protein
MLISIFDTRICDNNLGNHIIMDSIDKVLHEMYPEAFFVSLPYLESIGDVACDYNQASDYTFFGGTNSLSSEMRTYRQWGLDAKIAKRLAGVILLGVGWWQYQKEPDAYTRSILRKVLHPEYCHSVRDSFTASQLRAAGFENVCNTGCPTLWPLTPEHCTSIASCAAKDVLLTFTNYNQNPKMDRQLADILKDLYRDVYFWIQCPEDAAYISQILPEAKIIGPRLERLDAILASSLDIEYVGTRLHAGIRAMQHKRRTTIIEVDNRAREMRLDFKLPSVPREEIASLKARLTGEFATELAIPWRTIDSWKQQFLEKK